MIGPNEDMPCRTTVSRQALDDVYDVMFDHVKKEVRAVSDFGCITLDGWSDRHKKNSFFGFTYHAISGKNLILHFLFFFVLLNPEIRW